MYGNKGEMNINAHNKDNMRHVIYLVRKNAYVFSLQLQL